MANASKPAPLRQAMAGTSTGDNSIKERGANKRMRVSSVTEDALSSNTKKVKLSPSAVHDGDSGALVWEDSLQSIESIENMNETDIENLVSKWWSKIWKLPNEKFTKQKSAVLYSLRKIVQEDKWPVVKGWELWKAVIVKSRDGYDKKHFLDVSDWDPNRTDSRGRPNAKKAAAAISTLEIAANSARHSANKAIRVLKGFPLYQILLVDETKAGLGKKESKNLLAAMDGGLRSVLDRWFRKTLAYRCPSASQTEISEVVGPFAPPGGVKKQTGGSKAEVWDRKFPQELEALLKRCTQVPEGASPPQCIDKITTVLEEAKAEGMLPSGPTQGEEEEQLEPEEVLEGTLVDENIRDSHGELKQDTPEVTTLEEENASMSLKQDQRERFEGPPALSEEEVWARCMGAITQQELDI